MLGKMLLQLLERKYLGLRPHDTQETNPWLLTLVYHYQPIVLDFVLKKFGKSLEKS